MNFKLTLLLLLIALLTINLSEARRRKRKFRRRRYGRRRYGKRYGWRKRYGKSPYGRIRKPVCKIKKIYRPRRYDSFAEDLLKLREMDEQSYEDFINNFNDAVGNDDEEFFDMLDEIFNMDDDELKDFLTEDAEPLETADEYPDELMQQLADDLDLRVEMIQ